MAQLLFTEVAEETQLAINDIPGVQAQFPQLTVLARYMTRVANRLMPAMPEEILDDDVLGTQRIGLEVNSIDITLPADALVDGQVALPENCNGVNHITVLGAHEQIFIHPSFASYRQSVAKMRTAPANIDEWHFCKQGSMLRFYPIPPSERAADISFVKTVQNPYDTQGFFLIPDACVRSIAMTTVAWFKLADAKPDQMQMLQAMASRELLMLIGVERLRRVLRDVNISQKFIDLLLGQIQL